MQPAVDGGSDERAQVDATRRADMLNLKSLSGKRRDPLSRNVAVRWCEQDPLNLEATTTAESARQNGIARLLQAAPERLQLLDAMFRILAFSALHLDERQPKAILRCADDEPVRADLGSRDIIVVDLEDEENASEVARAADREVDAALLRDAAIAVYIEQDSFEQIARRRARRTRCGHGATYSTSRTAQ